jgi:hypothetical protein
LLIRGNKNGFVTTKDALYNCTSNNNNDEMMSTSTGFIGGGAVHTSILNSQGFFDLKSVIIKR